MYHPAFLIGVQLFNRGDFFEAHEFWEDVWNETAGSQRDFYKGLIQVAVGMCHLYNGNARGARRLYHSSRGLLTGFAPHHQGIDLDRLFEDLDRCFEPVITDPNVDWLTNEQIGELSVALELQPEPEEWPEVPLEER